MRILVAIFLIVAGCAAEPEPTVSADLVIQNAFVLNFETGQFDKAETVIVFDQKITHVGGAISFDERAEILDGAGGYIVPGFWDAHVHSITAANWHFPMLVRFGVTNVRNMHTSEPDPFDKISSLKSRVASGELLGPTMIANGPILDGTHSVWPGTIVVASRDKAEKTVEELKISGADFIKVYDSLAPDVYEALSIAAQKYGLAVDGHMPAQLDPRDAARLGHRSVEHMSGLVIGCSSAQGRIQESYAELFAAEPLPFPQNMMAFFDLIGELNATWDEAKCNELIDVYAAGNIAVTPTLVNGVSMTNPRSLIEDEGVTELVPEEILDRWMPDLNSPRNQMMQAIMAPLQANTPRMLSMLKDADVPIVAGTDLGNSFLIPGHSLHTEMELLVDAGLTPLDALRAATLTPSKVFAPERQTGRIKSGYEADLILLDRDPLVDISNTRSIRQVVLRGSLIDIDGN